ncbi:MAG TPA: UDP-N-acetylglucosamine--N-acetylmuramyl-(pentapeptide) pyrophosphoryl-undecaprenol N-acetylglucosamine transferase [Fimbriimonas sp.]|nr:UDP-N-acetylglucosamine--N-acetylmuramyl-(pentapeptide) pyrophosphoryl-undecaprenol N-acetylglucosamine transferase [Fimbriimonas sp.]
MFLVVTGGGTGGHVYPALETAKAARERLGARLLYLGAHRGQESGVCEREGIDFRGFDARPLYSLKQPRGWDSLVRLLIASQRAKKALKENRPDVVFSTGGYSAAPVMSAARSLGIPYVIHEANSVPGRANRMFAPGAAAFTCVFTETQRRIPTAVRTGQPIRRELREAASLPRRETDTPLVICLGGSQGSVFLNEVVVKAAPLLRSSADVVLAAGKGNFDKVAKSERIKVVPFLETPELVEAYRGASVAVARSGGTLAEFALFGLPSVLVPLPTSADDHQLVNAQEFVAFKGAKLLRQDTATPEALAGAVDDWLADDDARETARRALKEWDRPDATERIVEIVRNAAENGK